MPGSIHISATQPPATPPFFLQVAVGTREYSGNLEKNDLSFPVTSLRDSVVITLHNADRELISNTELMTKAIVESGTIDVVFTLDSGGKVILKLQFLLSDDDRKRIQEMRNSAMKRKQQELLGDGYELSFPDSPLSKRLIEKISNIQSKGDQRPKLRKSGSLDDLQDRAVLSGINVDPRMKALRDLLLQSVGSNTSRFEDPNGSNKGSGKPESKSSSSVNNMISAFEGTSSQGTLSKETGASLTGSGSTQTGKAIVPMGDSRVSTYRSGKNASLQHKKSNAYESRGSRRSSSRYGASKQNVGENEVSRSKRKPRAKKHVEQLHLGCQVSYLVATWSTWMHPHVCVTTASRQLKDLLELEHLSSSLKHIEDAGRRQGTEESPSDGGSTASVPTQTQSGVLNNGWFINQGVRAAIVIVACGAMFLNNR